MRPNETDIIRLIEKCWYVSCISSAACINRPISQTPHLASCVNAITLIFFVFITFTDGIFTLQ